MTRSCLTCDIKAEEYTCTLRGYFWDVYMSDENITARNSDPDNHHMAAFLLGADDLMNQTAAKLWPRGGMQHAVPLPTGR